MYGYACKHCGQLELAHLPDLEEHIRDNFRVLPDQEHAEELHIERLDELTEHVPGYRYHLIECPGFEYEANISIKELARRVAESPHQLDYLPDDLQKKVRAFQENLERNPPPRKPSSWGHYGGGSVYISFDPRRGYSTIAYGE